MRKLLIYSGELLNPPTDLFLFRSTNLFSKTLVGVEDILIETPPELTDIYWKWLKKNYAFDFISDFLSPETNESGLRVSLKFIKTPNIVTDRINLGNYVKILKQIEGSFR